MKNRGKRAAVLCMTGMMVLQSAAFANAGSVKNNTTKEQNVAAGDTKKKDKKAASADSKKDEKQTAANTVVNTIQEKLELNKWGENEVLKMVPAPKTGTIVQAWMNKNQKYAWVKFDGVTEADFKAYLEELNKAEFKEVQMKQQESKEQKADQKAEKNVKEEKKEFSDITLAKGATNVNISHVKEQMFICIGNMEAIVGTKKVTAEDIKKLSEKKDKLSWSDLAVFLDDKDTDAGLVMATFETVENGTLRIVGDKADKVIFSALLIKSGDQAEVMDICAQAIADPEKQKRDQTDKKENTTIKKSNQQTKKNDTADGDKNIVKKADANNKPQKDQKAGK